MTGKPPRIVVIEDNPADVALLRRALDEQGEEYDFLVISDGEKALRFVDEQREAVDLVPCVILLDLHLPRHDGAAVLRAIAREPKLNHVQVAVWTTLASPLEKEEAMRCGADLYRLKPTSLEGFWELAEILLELCHGRAKKLAVT